MTKTKVLLDTDIDIVGDIDDVMCLAYLLAQPACELLGITTVSWATDKRAMVASALCKAADRRVPIFPGAEVPILAPLPAVEARQSYAIEHAVLERWDHEEVFPRGQAVEFLRRTIRDNPGEVILLAIGPLTNVALLFAVDPEIPSLLKGLVMMAGRFASDGTARVSLNGTPCSTRMQLPWCTVQMSASIVRSALMSPSSSS